MRLHRVRSSRPALIAAGTCLLLAGCTSSGGGAASPSVSSPAPPTASASATSSPAASGSATGAAAAPADWPTYHGNPQRSGVSTDMPPVAGTPRLAAALKLDGQVYASPIIVGGTVIAATENDTVYALDVHGHLRWKRNLGHPSPAGERPCGNIDPLGITGTPVAVGSTVYVAAELGGPPRHQLVALNLTTGAVRWRRSLDAPGVETKAMQERGALTVSGGRVWVPFGGLAGDCGGYKGRVIGYALTGKNAPAVYTVPTAREAGIWTPPGPAVDDAGNLYVAVGNGQSGVGDKYDFSDSVLKINISGRLADSFSPSTWATDNDADLDLGSQGPTLVGPWVFSAGKSGTAYVLRRDRLGGIGGQLSEAPVCKSFGGTSVVGDVVYVPCTDGVRAVRVDSAGQLSVLWHADGSITGSPVVGGGRVWALDQTGGVLHALDPKTGASREQVRVGETSRFATPALYGADVLVPTLAGLAVVTTS